VNTRGVAYDNGKIFVGRLDGKLAALDAKTGKELWVTTVVDYKQGSVITSPPVVAHGKVITGFGGGEYGARGSIQAYDANTGKELWRTYTVPLANEPGGETWKGDSAVHGGGVAWLVPSYDAKTNTVYYGTSNPGPWATAVRSTGDSNYGKLTNKWTSATLALDADSGKIKWGFQETPADAWDYDGVNEFVLADLKINGKETPVGMKADRNGFFYVLNRDTGALVSAEKFVFTNWASKIDLASGLPVEDPAKRPGPDHPAKDICPNLVGGKNWQPVSFSPRTGLVYIPANNICQDMSEAKSVDYKKGIFFLGKDFSASAGPGDFLGDIEAWDPVAKKAVWHIHEKLPFNGGMLSTGGDVVFYGSLAGVFKAVDAKTGKLLWSQQVGSGVGAAPITYSVGGKQYVAVVVGRTAAIPAFLGDVGKQMTDATPEGGSLFVFTE
jgi:alcohol dehydrogenase (cytochrome c)